MRPSVRVGRSTDRGLRQQKPSSWLRRISEPAVPIISPRLIRCKRKHQTAADARWTKPFSIAADASALPPPINSQRSPRVRALTNEPSVIVGRLFGGQHRRPKDARSRPTVTFNHSDDSNTKDGLRVKQVTRSYCRQISSVQL